jgi:hypothetical protein
LNIAGERETRNNSLLRMGPIRGAPFGRLGRREIYDFPLGISKITVFAGSNSFVRDQKSQLTDFIATTNVSPKKKNRNCSIRDPELQLNHQDRFSEV